MIAVMRSLTPFPDLRRLLGLVALAAGLVACGPDASTPPPGEGAAPTAGSGEAERPRQEIFIEQSAATGLDFVHFNGMSGELYYSEHMGGGVALFDYDRDGDLDVYVTQGHMLGADKTLADASFPPSEEPPFYDRLFRNDLEAGGGLRFTDVTEESGLRVDGYGMGVAVGDVDNDGWPDLYVTQWNSANRLLRNGGDGTFRDITEEAGVGEQRWSIAAVFFDYDRDGWLDLYVGNYLDFTFSVHRECANEVGLADYCGPVSFKSVTDTLYRNRGDGTFEDATAAAGITQDAAPVLGAVTGDFDDNGWLDLYLANDEEPNNLLLNQGADDSGRVTFRDEALLAGAAMNNEGKAEAGMGVNAGDFDNDGDEDLFVSHLDQETNTLYINDGGGVFTDRTVEAGLGAPSFDSTGFGTAFFDYDNDGWLDLLVANGAVQGLRDLMLAKDPHPMHQKNQLFHNLGNGRYEDVSARAGAVLELSEVSRGAAFGDLDNDGDSDVVIHNNAGPLRLLINQVGQDHSWLGLRLTGASVDRDQVGAWVEMLQPKPLARRVRGDSSYASAHDTRVLFGLGDATGPATVRVTWPNGQREIFDALPLGQYRTLRQGDGQAEAAGGGAP